MPKGLFYYFVQRSVLGQIQQTILTNLECIMLDNIDLNNVLFLDIETAPVAHTWKQLPGEYRELWEKKAAFFRREDEPAEELWERAGLFAEFGKVICVSVGKYYTKDEQPFFRVKSFYAEEEKELLTALSSMLIAYRKKKPFSLCAHNGKEFDFPFLARRMLVHGLRLPDVLNVAGMKPWEVNLLDTMHLWKFGDYKHFTSLALLSFLFDIPSPKNDMDGSQVADVYYKQQDIMRIVRYCEQDVLTVAQLLLRFKGMALLEESQVERLTSET